MPPGPGESALAPAFSPLYQQIKSLLLNGLRLGEWKPGELIPSEVELAGRFKVSQGTVRKAIDELATGHLLIRKQGKGTFVATHSADNMKLRFLRLTSIDGQKELLKNEGVDTTRISLSDLFKQIHRNNKDVDKQINELIDNLKPLATSNAGSAVMLMPTVKDLITWATDDSLPATTKIARQQTLADILGNALGRVSTVEAVKPLKDGGVSEGSKKFVETQKLCYVLLV